MHYADPAQPLTAAGKRIAEVWNKGRERQEKKERIVREQQARKERNNKNERQRKSKKGQKAARRFVWDVWGVGVCLVSRRAEQPRSRRISSLGRTDRLNTKNS